MPVAAAHMICSALAASRGRPRYARTVTNVHTLGELAPPLPVWGLCVRLADMATISAVVPIAAVVTSLKT
jgi:hypothetical protein